MVAMLLSLTHVHCPRSREVREGDACSKLRVWEVNALHLVRLSSCKPAQQACPLDLDGCTIESIRIIFSGETSVLRIHVADAHLHPLQG